MSHEISSRQILLGTIRAVAWRHLYKWIKMPANLVPTVMFPLVFFLSFAGGLSAVQNVPGFDYDAGYTTFQYGFVLLQASMFGGVATGFSIAGDFATGFSKRLLLCSAHRSGIIIGYMCSSLIRAIAVTGVVTIVASIGKLNIYGSPVELLQIFVLCVVINMSATLWGAGVMMRARNPQFAPAMQVPVFLLMFIAPVFFPLEMLSGWIHRLARVNPISWILESVRGFLNGTPDHSAVAFVCVAVIFVVACVWGFSGLRRAERAG